MVFEKYVDLRHTHTHTHIHTHTHTHTLSTVRGWTVPPCFSQTLLHAGTTPASSLYISISNTHARTQPHNQTHTSLFHSLVVINPFLFSSLIAVCHCCVCVCVCACVCAAQTTEMLFLLLSFILQLPPSSTFSPSHTILHPFFEREMHNSEGKLSILTVVW